MLLNRGIQKMEGNIEENATRVPGTVIADMSGWTYDAPGAEGLVSSQMFDGAIAMNNRLVYYKRLRDGDCRYGECSYACRFPHPSHVWFRLL